MQFIMTTHSRTLVGTYGTTVIVQENPGFGAVNAMADGYLFGSEVGIYGKFSVQLPLTVTFISQARPRPATTVPDVSKQSTDRWMRWMRIDALARGANV